MKLPSLKNLVVTTIIVYLWVMTARLMFIGPPSAMGAVVALIPASLLGLLGLVVAAELRMSTRTSRAPKIRQSERYNTARRKGHDRPAQRIRPFFNVNGSPMVGFVDIHGNTYGSTIKDHLHR